MRTTVKERLITYLAYKGIPKSRFEKQCGFANGFINNICVSMQPDKVERIAAIYPELSTGWLMTGEGSMLKEMPLYIPAASNYTLTSVKGRLKFYLRKNNIKSVHFCASIGASAAFISSMRQSISPDYLQRIAAKYPLLNISWLLTGNGNMLKEEAEKKDSSPVNFRMVRVVNQYAYAGYLRGYADNEYLKELNTIPVMINSGDVIGELLAFEVKGDSMDDNTARAMQDGDVLVCQEVGKELIPDLKRYIGKWRFVIVCRDGILIKQISDVDTENERLGIHSLNPLYPDASVEFADVMKLFRVLKIERSEI